jgi:hypothetical protein
MLSEREKQKLFEQYNPNQVRVGDRVLVSVGSRYPARIVGLSLDIKNRKVYAHLKLLDRNLGAAYPTKVDAADCYSSGPLYPGHHTNG